MTENKKYESDVQGRGTYADPLFYVLYGPSYDGTLQIMCDTLNCHHMFSSEDQSVYMSKLADALNNYEWKLIDNDTPKDQLIVVFAPGDNPNFGAPLPDIVCLCQWHPDAGFCVDELRHPTHWKPFKRPT